MPQYQLPPGPNSNTYFGPLSATKSFTLPEGKYGVTVTATFSSGSVTLEKLSHDGTTYVPVLPAFTANGYGVIDLPASSYQLVIATATAVYAAIESIIT